MSANDKAWGALELGGIPRVHLLPPEIEGQRRDKAVRRSLLRGLVAAVLLVIVAIGGVSLLLSTAIVNQATEQAQGSLLATQLKKYSAVIGIQSQVDAITTAQPVGVTGEILWAPFIASVQATLPTGTAITSFTASLDAVGDDGTTKPLVGDHIATISVTAQGPQDILTGWLAQLTSIKGVVGATPGEFAISPDPGQYVVNVDLFVNNDVVADRFKPGN